MNKRNIGLVMIAAAVLLIFMNSANGVGGVFKQDDKQVSCKLNFDRDSLNSAVCNTVDTCNANNFFTFGTQLFGVDEDVTIRLMVDGRTYETEKFDTDFGFNEEALMSACVPGTSTKITAQLLSEGGTVVASKEASLQ